MYSATGRRITIAIGVLALSLAMVSPTVTWAAEPAKQEKKAKKPAKAPASAPTSKAASPNVTAPKFASAETAGKAPSCIGEAPKLDKVTPDEGKSGTKVTITGTNLARQPVYEASPSARVTQPSLNRPMTASARPCHKAERKAWSSSPSPRPREKTQNRSL